MELEEFDSQDCSGEAKMTWRIAATGVCEKIEVNGQAQYWQADCATMTEGKTLKICSDDMCNECNTVSDLQPQGECGKSLIGQQGMKWKCEQFDQNPDKPPEYAKVDDALAMSPEACASMNGPSVCGFAEGANFERPFQQPFIPNRVLTWEDPETWNYPCTVKYVECALAGEDAYEGGEDCENSKKYENSLAGEVCTLRDVVVASDKYMKEVPEGPKEVPVIHKGPDAEAGTDVRAWYDVYDLVFAGTDYPVFKTMPESGSEASTGAEVNGLRIDIQLAHGCACMGHGRPLSPGDKAVMAMITDGKDPTDRYPDGKPKLYPYPADLGYNCRAWDLFRHPLCKDKATSPDWCFQRWCYVDPCQCNPQWQIAFSNYNDWNRPQLRTDRYYSYDVCNGVDTYTGLQKCKDMTLEMCQHSVQCKIERKGAGASCVPVLTDTERCDRANREISYLKDGGNTYTCPADECMIDPVTRKCRKRESDDPKGDASFVDPTCWAKLGHNKLGQTGPTSAVQQNGKRMNDTIIAADGEQLDFSVMNRFVEEFSKKESLEAKMDREDLEIIQLENRLLKLENKRELILSLAAKSAASSLQQGNSTRSTMTLAEQQLNAQNQVTRSFSKVDKKHEEAVKAATAALLATAEEKQRKREKEQSALLQQQQVGQNLTKAEEKHGEAVGPMKSMTDKKNTQKLSRLLRLLFFKHLRKL